MKKAQEDIACRLMLPGEEAEVSILVGSVFSEFVGPLYPPEGRREFLGYARPEVLRERFLSDHFTLVALSAERIVGTIEVRQHHHVCLFFVDGRYQGCGIGRMLFETALARCREERPAPAAVSVNSSPNSVGVYKRLGFHPTGPTETKNGITFVPMARVVT